MDYTTNTISLEDIEGARKRLDGKVGSSPLIPLNYLVPDINIYLKLENLQPIGSFKLRGACNVLGKLSADQLKDGVYTASAGNFAQGLAWNTQKLGIPCNVIVPDHAPAAKLSAIKRLGGEIVKVPFSEWWKVLETHNFDGMAGTFVHPVSDPAVIAGNGTIGLEIFESLPEVDAIIAPYGGGGLSCGIASAIKALKPDVKVYACEVDTAAPLKASMTEDRPVEFDYKASFIDGMGGKSVLTEMWPLARKLLDDSIVVKLQEVVDALKLMAERNHVIAEGAGAAPLAAALSGKAGKGNIVCVVSGGNIDTDKLTTILQGNIP
ncbi:L-threonine dehydratase catabolic TdcB-like [Ylistrum balloti]|uniref:L-threonine dehydratase catabolic TdcB-like n=1 Tax=Ylistrum balloti TaxID=509963 RepID=UPI002905B8BD|nr:L-threonine dehydratase catabolic TdcB-like [Ylistrum balloti]